MESVGHLCRVGFTQQLPDRFVVREEERFVLLDGAAKAAAKLVLAQRRDRGSRRARRQEIIEVLARVKGAIAQELIRGPVDAIGARLTDRVDDRAVAAELRAEGIGQRLELADGLDAQGVAGNRSDSLVPIGDQVFVIQQDLLALGPSSGHRVLIRASLKTGALERRVRRHAGRQLDQLFEVTAVQRQFAHLALIHQGGHRGVGRFHLRGLAFDGHSLLLLADGQCEIDHRLRADVQRDAFVNQRGKTGFGRLHLILADAQIGDAETPLRIAGHGLIPAGADVMNLHGGLRNSGPGHIGNSAKDGARGALREKASRTQKHHKQRKAE